MVRAQNTRNAKLLTRHSIVFSYWRRSLDVVGSLLTDKHIPYLRVDGTIPSAKRREVLEKFQKQEDIPVLLMTLGTGAVGYDAYLLVIPKR
jgi:SWI/SNF-related matrix-associated actin-dependent regulator of chromatin subfamily A3